MIITPANNAFFVTSVLEPRFWAAFGVTEAWWSKVATPYNVEGEQMIIPWMGMIDKYREWVGPRRTRQPAPQTYLVPIKNFELTEELDEFRLADSTAATATSYYAPTLAFMGLQAKKIYDYNLRDMIENASGGAWGGSFQNGTDGLSNWNTAHPIDFYDASKGTYPNDYRGGLTISGTSVGGAFSTNGFNTAWEDMSARKSESGERLGVAPDLGMFPIQLKAAAMTILQNTMFAPPQMGVLGSGSGANAPFVGAMDNVLRGWVDLMINQDLMNANDWYLLTTRSVVKPFSVLMRLAPDFVPRVSPDDPVVFNEHKLLYGSKARLAVAWALPWLSSISGPTAGA